VRVASDATGTDMSPERFGAQVPRERRGEIGIVVGMYDHEPWDRTLAIEVEFADGEREPFAPSQIST